MQRPYFAHLRRVKVGVEPTVPLPHHREKPYRRHNGFGHGKYYFQKYVPFVSPVDVRRFFYLLRQPFEELLYNDYVPYVHYVRQNVHPYVIGKPQPVDNDVSGDKSAVEKYAENEPNWIVADDNREGIRVSFDKENGDGWFLLRLSVHDPIMPLNIESDSVGGVEKIYNQFYQFLKTTKGLEY